MSYSLALIIVKQILEKLYRAHMFPKFVNIADISTFILYTTIAQLISMV